jgi:hypothetical protein
MKTRFFCLFLIFLSFRTGNGNIRFRWKYVSIGFGRTQP